MAHRGWKRDGFTPEKKARALRALETCGNVTDAARVAGVSDTTFYRHLNKDTEFERLCGIARAKAAAPLETLAWERAVHGGLETVIRDGKVVQEKRKPSDAMLRLLLQASNPKKFGRLSLGGATRKQIEAQLRAEIEGGRKGGRRPRVASNEEVEKALVKRLAAYGARVRAKRGGGA